MRRRMYAELGGYAGYMLTPQRELQKIACSMQAIAEYEEEQEQEWKRKQEEQEREMERERRRMDGLSNSSNRRSR